MQASHLYLLYSDSVPEYHNNQDEYSRDIILAHIDSILKYLQRFYKRQFLNRTDLSGKVVSKFKKVIDAYFDNGSLQQKDLPSVTSMASLLNLSSRYLSDVLKQETGKAVMELIHIFLIPGCLKKKLALAPINIKR
ncbi:hypothetical protein [uncultured Mucilaginibacter sp.]|uniref:helix-turn-helix transcriptional regulator n=1 Tax=uncultured Mucilaginibacter sp. TaxID=797541 RepID=UPI002600F702|nr:hypothetical protein [uncultured Mucilaginibacter sp.]